MKKQAFLRFLTFLQDSNSQHDESTMGETYEQQRIAKGLLNNMLQISDFFQCLGALQFCIRHLEITRDNACLNLKEALKKVAQLQGQPGAEALTECWFTLIHKSIAVAAQSLQTTEDFEQLRGIGNSYITREVLERYIRSAVIEHGILNEALLSEALSLYSLERYGEELDSFEALAKECQVRVSRDRKRTYIEWVGSGGRSEPFSVDGLTWCFSAQTSDLGVTIYLNQVFPGEVT
jgi:hypothetical protein